MADPGCLALAASVLSTRDDSFGVDSEAAEQSLESTILEAAPKRHIYELIWALWIAAKLGSHLSEAAIKAVSQIDHPLVALVALHYQSATGNNFDTTLWEKHMTPENLYTENWLLVYEAHRHYWLPTVEETFDFPEGSLADLNFVDCSFYNLEAPLSDILEIEGISGPSFENIVKTAWDQSFNQTGPAE